MRGRVAGVRAVVVAAVLCGVTGPRADGQEPVAPETAAWLRAEFPFTADDLRDLGRGRAVARTLETGDTTEAAAAGAVLIAAPPERLLREFTDIDTTTLARGVESLGVFSTPPVPADLATLRLTGEDLAALRTCRPGDCAVKLPRAVIDRLARVPWGTRDAPAEATAIVDEWLLAHLSRYLREGNAGLGVLDDKRPSVDLAGELARVLAHDGVLARVAPGAAAYLADGANGARPMSESLYWVRVSFGLKPMIRVSHVAVHDTPGAPGGVTHVVTSKQIYASHYVRAAVELRLIVPQPGGGFLLVTTSRTRNDGMTGVLGLVVRGNVRRRSRDVLARYLEAVKLATEADRRGGIVGE